jgi:hypothetical protein
LSQSIGIYKDVSGAPFHVGQCVRVVMIADETGDRAFLGKDGVVAYFEYSCGCGQSFPKDPMIGVRFKNNSEEFWKEELSTVVDNPVSHFDSNEHAK